MLMFPGMLVEAAEKAGMKVPEDPDNFSPDEFPHFHVFCNIQLGVPLPSWDVHWENAKVIAGLSDKEVKSISFAGLEEKGYRA